MIIKSLNIKYINKKNSIIKKCYNFNTHIVDDDIEFEIFEKMTDFDKKTYVNFKSKSTIELISIEIEINYKYSSKSRIFANGFQSWSESREYTFNEVQNNLNKFFYPIYSHYKMQYFGDEFFVKSRKKERGEFYSHTYSYIREENNINLIGSLSERSGFTVIKHCAKKNKIVLIKDLEGVKFRKGDIASIFEIYTISGDETFVFDKYFNAMNIPIPNENYCTGWTSWYNYYTNISEEIILSNLENFSSQNIPIDIFQIDDGYQTYVGDWLSINEKFPNGMKYISDAIRQKSFKSGLWLAPFICQEQSELFKNNSDWIIKDKKGIPLCIGYSGAWNGKFYAIDIYNTDFQDYLNDVFNTVLNNWNFDMVKLDFLFGACINPNYNKSRGNIMCDAMDLLRKIVGNKIILGCGVPLGPAFGKVDYCRISSDVGLYWEDYFLGNIIGYNERVSTKNAITSTIGRRHLNNRAFINDPDVFFLRDDNIKMNYYQKNTLLLINLIFGGLIFTSDNILKYNNETLMTYKKIFPLKEKNILKVDFKKNIYLVNFIVDKFNYYFYINIDKSKIGEVNLLPGYYFFNDKFYSQNIELKPCESVCLLKLSDKSPSIAGTTGSLIAATDISLFVKTKEFINIRVNSINPNENKLYIKIDNDQEGYTINGKYRNATKLNDDLNLVCLKYNEI